jgi:23S rRNA (cytidine1920-2'-O)/16S rRNA (cytidine1409-2'-O)-methyltransferase
LNPGKERADVILVRSGLAETRQKAQALILSGQVYFGEKRVDKSGDFLPQDAVLMVRANPCPFVSRGGLKLEGALKALRIEVAGLSCMDVGASTGGFTDCLLRNGAARVIAIDVGHNQLHFRLRQDSRVHCIEGYNVRFLKCGDLPYIPELAVADVSFISLRIILRALKEALPGIKVLALVKPQFEAGKGKVGKGGVVRDESVKAEAVMSVKREAETLGFEVTGEATSPIKGPKGNEEFFLYLE